MAKQQSTPMEPISALLSEFGTRLNEMEEKHRLVKDRVLLIGENLISTKEEVENQESDFKKHFKQLDFEIKEIKQLNKRIVNELGNLARKTEFEILERQMKIFQPLDVARIGDIKRIVQEEFEKQNKNIKKEEIN